MTAAVRHDFRSLTGLRALAALAVFSLHVNGGINGNVHTDLGYVSNAGGLAVSCFFVLSGTVLAWSTGEHASARGFWWRRVARIYPVYLVAVIGAAVIASVTYHAVVSRGPVLASVFLVQAWVPRESYYFGSDAVAWSLSCEAFFYAVAPLLFRWMRRLQHRGLAAVAVGAVLALAGIQALATHIGYPTGDPTRSLTYWFVYVCPLGRLPEFVVGVAVGLALRRGLVRPVPLLSAPLVLVAGIYIALHNGTFLSYSALTVAGFATLVAALAARERAGLPIFLTSPGWVFAGRCSYAFYLVHLTVISRIEWAHGQQPQSGWDAIAFVLTAAVLSAAVAVAVTVGVEWPGRWLLLRVTHHDHPTVLSPARRTTLLANASALPATSQRVGDR